MGEPCLFIPIWVRHWIVSTWFWAIWRCLGTIWRAYPLQLSSSIHSSVFLWGWSLGWNWVIHWFPADFTDWQPNSILRSSCRCYSKLHGIPWPGCGRTGRNFWLSQDSSVFASWSCLVSVGRTTRSRGQDLCTLNQCHSWLFAKIAEHHPGWDLISWKFISWIRTCGRSACQCCWAFHDFWLSYLQPILRGYRSIWRWRWSRCI